MVSASGATRGFLPLKEPRTESSMKSTIHSTKFCAPLGTPEVTDLATLRNNQRNSTPSSSEKPSVSTLIAQKPISLACSAVCAKPQWVPPLPSGN